MSLLLTKDRDGGDGDLGWVTSLDNDACVWVDEVAAVGTTKQSLGDDRLLVERRLAVELLLQLTVAARAAKLIVEGFLRLVRWCELVSVALNGSPTEFRVHLFEDGHAERVAEWQQ